MGLKDLPLTAFGDENRRISAQRHVFEDVYRGDVKADTQFFLSRRAIRTCSGIISEDGESLPSLKESGGGGRADDRGAKTSRPNRLIVAGRVQLSTTVLSSFVFLHIVRWCAWSASSCWQHNEPITINSI